MNLLLVQKLRTHVYQLLMSLEIYHAKKVKKSFHRRKHRDLKVCSMSLVIINDKQRLIWNLGVVPFDVNGQLFLSWGVNGEPILMNQYKIVVGTVQSNNGKYITYIDKMNRRRKGACQKIRRLY